MGSIIARMGFIELIVRLVVMVMGPIIEKQSNGYYALIYSVMCGLVGGICINLTIYPELYEDTKIWLQVSFLLLPLPMGVMNSLILPAGNNIFGQKMNEKIIWPYSCTFLAIGFFTGPVVFEGLNRQFGMDSGFRVAGIGAFVSAFIFLGLCVWRRKQDT